MNKRRVLLVDDNGDILQSMKVLLERQDFEVVTATSVGNALREVVSQPFDVLITDLHLPNPGDGFAVVAAMRHSQPEAFTIVLSGYPDIKESAAAILLEADAVIVKPFDVASLIELIDKREKKAKPLRSSKETVASILERDANITVERWLHRVNQSEELSRIPLSDAQRTGHLAAITKQIAVRLRERPLMESGMTDSPAAVDHGQLRYHQGYTASLLVQESRILQVCIFETIKRNLSKVDFSILLPDIMVIADEVDSQLAQSIESFVKLQQSASASA